MKNKLKLFLYCVSTCALLISGEIKGIAQEIVKSPASFSFNRIQVKGNVKLYLRQGNKESIQVQTTNDSETVSVTRRGHQLLISSKEFNPVDVYITITDLRSIQVADQAIVATIGELKFRHFQVFLQDDALARLRVNASSLYTEIKGNACLKLNGTTTQYTYAKEKGAKLETDKFVALKTEISDQLPAPSGLNL